MFGCCCDILKQKWIFKSEGILLLLSPQKQWVFHQGYWCFPYHRGREFYSTMNLIKLTCNTFRCFASLMSQICKLCNASALVGSSSYPLLVYIIYYFYYVKTTFIFYESFCILNFMLGCFFCNPFWDSGNQWEVVLSTLQ